MLISELAVRTGVPVATLKYYLREQLLMPGVRLSATRSDYGDEHVRRVGVARALTEVVGLSVHQAREVFALFGAPRSELFESLGRAMAQLPPAGVPTADDYPRARAAIQQLGWIYDARYVAVAQLERALEGAETAGLGLTDERLDVYAPAIRAIADYDVAQVPEEPDRALEYSVLGTALYEPVLVALRRLAHQDAAARRLGAASPGATPDPPTGGSMAEE
jgi:DNA-binding transcriptional MerR regulator